MSLSNPSPRVDFGPADHGFITWSYDPSLAGNTQVLPTAGRLNDASVTTATGVPILPGGNWKRANVATFLIAGTAGQDVRWCSEDKE